MASRLCLLLGCGGTVQLDVDDRAQKVAVPMFVKAMFPFHLNETTEIANRNYERTSETEFTFKDVSMTIYVPYGVDITEEIRENAKKIIVKDVDPSQLRVHVENQLAMDLDE